MTGYEWLDDPEPAWMSEPGAEPYAQPVREYTAALREGVRRTLARLSQDDP